MNAIGLKNNKAFTSPGMDTFHVVEVVTAEVNVFFDGTENNYFNVTASDEVKAQHKSDDSYHNALSNVARMWKSMGDEEDSTAVYIDGIGTTRLGSDSLQGRASGTGDTGVAERVHGAFAKIQERVSKSQEKQQEGPPALLDINVYGFSRGAAAARYFVHLVNTESKQRFGKTWEKVHTRVNFAGLFDTVASVIDLRLQSNIEAFHLRFEENYALKVFHLTAGDECRVNFPLTNIASAVAQSRSNDTDHWSMGYELCIPGAHSDVGGGYVDGAREERDLPDLQRWGTERELLPGPSMQEFVYAKGWYSASDLEPNRRLWQSYRHSRRLSNEYYKVGLALMVDMAKKYTNTEYPSKLQSPPESPDVLEIFSALRGVVQTEKETHWTLEKHFGSAKARQIRHDFFHLSCADASLPNSPRRNDRGEFERQIIAG